MLDQNWTIEQLFNNKQRIVSDITKVGTITMETVIYYVKFIIICALVDHFGGRITGYTNNVRFPSGNPVQICLSVYNFAKGHICFIDKIKANITCVFVFVMIFTC